MGSSGIIEEMIDRVMSPDKKSNIVTATPKFEGDQVTMSFNNNNI